MRLRRALPVIAAAAVLAGPAPAAVAAPAGDVVPVLTSTPFGAVPGQPVTHAIGLSGTGVLTAVRVTFTTTVGLDGVAATASRGGCPIVTALTVVCDLGDVDLSDPPKVTVTGTVHPGTAPGTLVQNLVNVTAGTPDADPGNNVVSNAYLLPGGSGAAARTTAGASAPARPAPARAGRVPVAVAVAALALAAVAAAFLLRWRRRRG